MKPDSMRTAGTRKVGSIWSRASTRDSVDHGLEHALDALGVSVVERHIIPCFLLARWADPAIGRICVADVGDDPVLIMTSGWPELPGSFLC
jgi:hypothetical protein